MPDGIRINDAALEISPAALEALVGQKGADITLTRLDLSASEESLNTLLRGITPEGQTPPSVEISEGRVRLAGTKEGRTMGIDLKVGGLRLELTEGGLRLLSTGATGDGREA